MLRCHVPRTAYLLLSRVIGQEIDLALSQFEFCYLLEIYMYDVFDREAVMAKHLLLQRTVQKNVMLG